MASSNTSPSAASSGCNPFNKFNDFGRAAERMQAILSMLSDRMCDMVEEPDSCVTAGHQRRLELNWLVLEEVRHVFDRNLAVFREGEAALYRAGVLSNWKS